MTITDDKLYTLLKENEYLTEEQLANAKQAAATENISLFEAILEKDLIDDQNLGKLVAEDMHVPFVSLASVSIPQDVLALIPEDVSRKHHILAFSQDNQGISIATSRPENQDLIKHLSKKAGLPIHVFFATDKDLANASHFYKTQLQERFDSLLKEQMIKTTDPKLQEAPISKLFDLLVEYAYANKSSDIHIEPRAHDSLTRFRIDGVLHDVLTLPKELHTQLITRIKVLAKLRTDEHQSGQDGKLKIQLADEDLDIRVSILPIVNGEDAVLRLLSSKSRQFSLSSLGMSNENLEKIKKGYARPYGMLLVTGPTGSGKTTTIYAILKILNTRDKNIATIEDPVEYELKGINQIQVNTQTNLTFAEGLRSILRQDPDSVFVGEIRDHETADIAVNSAMTGHLVLSTLHTNDAPTAIPRLFDMGIEPFLVSSTVNIIVGQRLVRKVCDTCRVSYTQDRKELTLRLQDKVVTKYLGSKNQIRMYRGKGCSVCHQTGYIGRIGIFEILQVSAEIQKLITAKENAEIIKKQAIKEGMVTMFEDGLAKVQQGVTTVEEVLRATSQ